MKVNTPLFGCGNIQNFMIYLCSTDLEKYTNILCKNFIQYNQIKNFRILLNFRNQIFLTMKDIFT